MKQDNTKNRDATEDIQARHFRFEKGGTCWLSRRDFNVVQLNCQELVQRPAPGHSALKN